MLSIMSASFDKDDPIESDEETSDFDLSDEIIKMEIQLIMLAVKRQQGDVRAAANEIGVSVEYLNEKIRKYKIEGMLDSQLKH